MGKKEINKKEVRNIILAGVAGGAIGTGKGIGETVYSNYKTYNKVKKAFIDKNIGDYIQNGFSKKDAYKLLIEEFSKKKLPLNKVIPEYTGTAIHNAANAYQIKALADMPYKAIGGALTGVPLGILAYGQASKLIDKIEKKASDDMVYFNKVAEIVKLK